MVEYDFNKCQCVCETLGEAVVKSKPLYYLEIGLVVLIVLLVIIGLIIGFSKLQQPEEED